MFKAALLALLIPGTLFAIGHDFSTCAADLAENAEALRRYVGREGDEEARRAARINHLFTLWTAQKAIQLAWEPNLYGSTNTYDRLAFDLEARPVLRSRLGGWQRTQWTRGTSAMAFAISQRMWEFDFFRLSFFQNLADESRINLGRSLSSATPGEIEGSALSAASHISQSMEFADDDELPGYSDVDAHASSLLPRNLATDDVVQHSEAEGSLHTAEQLIEENWLPPRALEWLRQGVKFFRDLDLTPNLAFMRVVELLENARNLTNDD